MMIFCNTAMIEWVSKKQATIESSVFGAEFVAMKFGIEKLRGLRYKLHMMGVPIDGPSLVYGDNLSLSRILRHPNRNLKKRTTLFVTMRCTNWLQWANLFVLTYNQKVQLGYTVIDLEGTEEGTL